MGKFLYKIKKPYNLDVFNSISRYLSSRYKVLLFIVGMMYLCGDKSLVPRDDYRSLIFQPLLSSIIQVCSMAIFINTIEDNYVVKIDSLIKALLLSLCINIPNYVCSSLKNINYNLKDINVYNTYQFVYTYYVFYDIIMGFIAPGIVMLLYGLSLSDVVGFVGSLVFNIEYAEVYVIYILQLFILSLYEIFLPTILDIFISTYIVMYNVLFIKELIISRYNSSKI